MASEAQRKKSALLDWQNEKRYQEQRLKDPKSTSAQKTAAKKRIAEADAYIKKLKGAK